MALSAGPHLSPVVVVILGHGQPMDPIERALGLTAYVVMAATALLRRVGYQIRLRAYLSAGYLVLSVAAIVLPHGPYAHIALAAHPVIAMVLLGSLAARIVILASSIILVSASFARSLPGVARALALDPEQADPLDLVWLQPAVAAAFLACVMVILDRFHALLLRALAAQHRATADVQREAVERSVAQREREHEIRERQRLEREVAAIGDGECRRLGQDLHDRVCQQITGPLLRCQALEQRLDRGETLSDADFVAISSLLAATMDEAHNVHPLHGLPPHCGVEIPGRIFHQNQTSAEELLWFKENTMYKRAIRISGVLAVFALILAAQPNPIPIPQQQGVKPASQFIGNPAVPHTVVAPVIPQNPFMGINSGWNIVHNDTYMSDTYFTGGPLGYSPEVLSTLHATATAMGQVAASVFGSDGKMIGGLTLVDGTAGTTQSKLVLIDPTTLATIDALPFSEPRPVEVTRLFRPAGIYFYLDASDRVIAGTADRTIWVVTHTATKLYHDSTFDLTGVIPDADSIEALQPDFSGRIWVTTKGGLIATLDSNGNVLGKLQLPAGEKIVNGHASDETGGVFIVSTEAMYRFDADASGKPAITWREYYGAGTHVKSGQVETGSGSTPTLMGTDYVTITDNAQPKMNVLVYRRAKQAAGPRLHCAVPVFQGQGSNEQSLIATDRSIVVPNNFGYSGTDATTHGNTTKSGIARIDVESYGCRTVWTNEEVSAPSSVNKMSVANGLIYAYTKPKGPANTDAWYFTALDFESGAVVYSQLAGTGLLYNNHYAPVYLGPDGKTAYVGVLGGLIAIRDTK